MLVFLKSLGYKSLNFEGYFTKRFTSLKNIQSYAFFSKKNRLTYCPLLISLPTCFCESIFVFKKW